MCVHRDFVAKIFFRVNTSTELLTKISEFGCALGNKVTVVNFLLHNCPKCTGNAVFARSSKQHISCSYHRIMENQHGFSSRDHHLTLLC